MSSIFHDGPVNEVQDIYSLVILRKYRGEKGKTIMGISKDTYEVLKAKGARWREVTGVVLAKEEGYIYEHTIRQYIFHHEILADEGTMTNF